MRNVEIKAAVASLEPVRARLRRLDGAARRGVLRQLDWYFQVPKGRLKLRQVGTARDGELVAYLRPDRADARTSEFQRLTTPDAAGTRRLLARMLGPRACVRKRRELWLYRNARIHLDRVDGLGQFIEIEVPVTKGMRQAKALMRELREALAIGRGDLLSASYGELQDGTERLAKKRRPAAIAPEPRRRG